MAYGVVAWCYSTVSIAGYWAFGNLVKVRCSMCPHATAHALLPGRAGHCDGHCWSTTALQASRLQCMCCVRVSPSHYS